MQFWTVLNQDNLDNDYDATQLLNFNEIIRENSLAKKR